MLGLLTAEQPGYGEEEGPGCGQHGAYEQQTGGYDQQQSVHDQQQVGGYDHYMHLQPGEYDPQEQQGGYDLCQQPGGYGHQPSQLSIQLPDQPTSELSEASTVSPSSLKKLKFLTE